MTTHPFDDTEARFTVLVNDEEQFSLWPVVLPEPAGWRVVLGAGGGVPRAEAVAFVETQWQDLRPASLRRATDLAALRPYPDEVAAAYRARGYWTGQTLSALLEEAVAAFPDRPAVIDGERRWSYRGLDARVRRFAARLRSEGYGHGSRVVLHLPNVGEYVVALFGLALVGALPVFALAAHRENDIADIAGRARADAILTLDRPAPVDLAAVARRAAPAGVRVVTIGEADVADTAVTPAEASLATPSRPEEVAFLQLSGGTTGGPKLIPRTHDDYLYSVRESARICGLDERSVLLVVLPASHNFTMSSPGILGAIAVGACVVMSAVPSPDAALPLIERHRVTTTSLVPPLLLAWLNSAVDADLSSLRSIQVGGAKLSEAVARRVRPELGCTLQQVFGMAEGLVCYTRLDDPEETILSTQGRPISPDDEVLVVDDDDRPVPDGVAGHLLARGPYTIRGYYAAQEANRASFTADGFYRTGDLVVRDPGGALTVVGRAKDQINRGGEKVAPEQIENLLLEHPAVHDVSVVGLPDDVLGERIGAYVITRPGASTPLRALDLRRFLVERGCASFLIPDSVEFVDAFPQTGVGKVSKNRQRPAAAARA